MIKHSRIARSAADISDEALPLICNHRSDSFNLVVQASQARLYITSCLFAGRQAHV